MTVKNLWFLTDSGIIGEGVGGEDDGRLQFSFLYTGNKNIFCVEDGRQFFYGSPGCHYG